MVQQAIIARIERLCKERGMTLNQLAVKSGMAPSTIKNIIYGSSRNTGLNTIVRICNGLQITLLDFFNAEEFRSL